MEQGLLSGFFDVSRFATSIAQNITTKFRVCSTGPCMSLSGKYFSVKTLCSSGSLWWKLPGIHSPQKHWDLTEATETNFAADSLTGRISPVLPSAGIQVVL